MLFMPKKELMIKVELYDSIYHRKSVRNYKKESLSNEDMEAVEKSISSLDTLYDDICLKVHIIENGQKMRDISKGLINSYSNLKAPHYMIIASEEKDDYLENIGYALEKVVLELTTMGIGTCWIGAPINEELLKNIISIDNGQKPIIGIAFGYPEDKFDFMKKIVRAGKRKSKEEFSFGDFDSTWNKMLEAVKHAPSAMNSQPWRIFKQKDSADVYIVKRNVLKSIEPTNHIDAGIALRHLKVTADHFNKFIQIKKMDDRNSEDYTYITSITEYQNSTDYYYSMNAEEFFNNTVEADMHKVYEPFLKRLKKNARILDIGCGSGRDSLYFIKRCYRVTAIDASKQLCEMSSKLIGQQVLNIKFQDIEWEREFDGIWACASLLHVPKNEMGYVLDKLERSLKKRGIMYMSFKYGDFEGERNGRYFSDYDENSLKTLIDANGKLRILEMYITEDVRKDRENEKWINVIVERNIRKGLFS